MLMPAVFILCCVGGVGWIFLGFLVSVLWDLGKGRAKK